VRRLDIRQVLLDFIREMEPLGALPDIAGDYPHLPGTGYLVKIERAVCDFAANKISETEAQQIYSDVIGRVQVPQIPDDLRLPMIKTFLDGWHNAHRRYAMGALTLFRGIREEKATRKWLARHADDLWSPEALAQMPDDFVGPLAYWVKVTGELEMIFLGLWSVLLAMAASIRLPKTNPMTQAVCEMLAAVDALTHGRAKPVSEYEKTRQLSIVSGIPILLIEFATQADYELLRGEAIQPSLAELKLGHEVLARRYESDGATVRRVEIDVADYLRWLAKTKRKNCLQSQMSFVFEPYQDKVRKSAE
jgi:hypothetical protein